MNDLMIQGLQMVGATLVLIPFAAVQLKRMQPATRSYQLLNLLGAATLTVTASIERQYGFILLEGIWGIMSFVGLLQLGRPKTPA